MRGKGNPPDEALVVMFAEKFGVMPEEFEERITPFWWDWIIAYYGELSAAQKAKQEKHGRRKN